MRAYMVYYIYRYMMILILEKLFLEAILDVFYFPIWWYTAGAVRAGKRCLLWLARGNETLAPGIWLTHIFVPMFGQYDWQGRIVSFFMRLVQIIFRTAALAVWLACCFLFFMLWLALPLLVFYGILYGV